MELDFPLWSCWRRGAHFTDHPDGAVARLGLQPVHLPALHRAARGDGRLVAQKRPDQADEVRSARRASCPCDDVTAGRGGRHRADGTCHPCRHLPSSGGTVMRVTAIRAQTEPRRHNSSVCRAEHHRCRSARRQVQPPLRPQTPRGTGQAGSTGKFGLWCRRALGHFGKVGIHPSFQFYFHGKWAAFRVICPLTLLGCALRRAKLRPFWQLGACQTVRSLNCKNGNPGFSIQPDFCFPSGSAPAYFHDSHTCKASIFLKARTNDRSKMIFTWRTKE